MFQGCSPYSVRPNAGEGRYHVAGRKRHQTSHPINQRQRTMEETIKKGETRGVDQWECNVLYLQ